MKLSVIIPVYQVEHTLDLCVESVVTQEFTDMEVILIDDRSPDRCPQLCNEWAQRDSRISVIHKANGGLSSARNAGLDAARGEYITFVDSDDYLETGTYPKVMALLQAHPEYDILEFAVRKTYASGQQETLTLSGSTFRNAREYWLGEEAYTHAYSWNKVFRRELFRGVRYPTDRVFEDVHILPSLLSRARVIATTNEGYYCYRQNPDGITANADGHDCESLLEAQLKAAEHYGLFNAVPLTDAATRLYMHLLDIQLTTYWLKGGKPMLPYIETKPWGGHRATTARKLKWILLKVLRMKGLCLSYRVFYAVYLCINRTLSKTAHAH